MCGIVGIYAKQPQGKTNFSLVSNAVATMTKRGPDCQHIFTNEKICFGHARLSVIDLANAASQPMHDITGRYTIIYNGEVYNFLHLRNNLQKKGYKFKTDTDTEVILYSYIDEGAACLNKLNGFFAFAIYDSQEDILFIARDRVGQKPLLFYSNDDSFCFASEMKALIALEIPRKLDMNSLSMYLQYNYIPSPNTIFENVEKLDPGTYLTITKGKTMAVRYYNIPYNYSNFESISYDDAQATLRSLLELSVVDRMIADVPLGAFLSGGIDSSVVVAEASKYVKKLDTFSIGYADEPFFDETRYAQLVADKFKTNHHVFKLTNNDLFDNLYNVLDYIDEPFADSSAIAVNILSRETRKHVTVALSGDGADELLGGYNKHSAHLRAIESNSFNMMIKTLHSLSKNMPQSRNSYFGNRIRQINRYADGLKHNYKDRYIAWASLMNAEKAQSLINNNISKQELNKRETNITDCIRNANQIKDILYADMHLVLVSDMLFKVDMMSMANSLEVRNPFLDYRIINFIFSLPDNYLINKNMRKRVLRDAYKDVLPAELYRRPKHGFEVPLLNWFKGELKSTIENDYLNDEFIREQKIFNPEQVKLLLAQLQSNNPGDVQAHIWALIVFQHWWKKYAV